MDIEKEPKKKNSSETASKAKEVEKKIAKTTEKAIKEKTASTSDKTELKDLKTSNKVDKLATPKQAEIKNKTSKESVPKALPKDKQSKKSSTGESSELAHNLFGGPIQRSEKIVLPRGNQSSLTRFGNPSGVSKRKTIILDSDEDAKLAEQRKLKARKQRPVKNKSAVTIKPPTIFSGQSLPISPGIPPTSNKYVGGVAPAPRFTAGEVFVPQNPWAELYDTTHGGRCRTCHKRKGDLSWSKHNCSLDHLYNLKSNKKFNDFLKAVDSLHRIPLHCELCGTTYHSPVHYWIHKDSPEHQRRKQVLETFLRGAHHGSSLFVPWPVIEQPVKITLEQISQKLNTLYQN